MMLLKKMTLVSMLVLNLGNSPISDSDPLEYNPSKPLGDVDHIDKAVTQFKKNTQFNIKLPNFIPFKVTYSGAQYDSTNKKILIMYLNEKTGALMDVQIKQGSMPSKLKARQKMISLNGENDAIYDNDKSKNVNFIYFYNNGIEYRVGLTKSPTEYHLHTFIKVAKSFE